MSLASVRVYKYSHTIIRAGYLPPLPLNGCYQLDFTLDDCNGFVIPGDQPWRHTGSYISWCLRVFHVRIVDLTGSLVGTNDWSTQAVRRDLPTDFHLLSLAESEDRQLAVVEFGEFCRSAANLGLSY